MANQSTNYSWHNNPRVIQGFVAASFMGSIILGSLAPDIDILWHGHRGWTHNPLVPMGVCVGVAILAVMGFAYSRRPGKVGILK